MTVVTAQLQRDDVDEVVNACDAGREGELIFAYLYEKAKANKPVQRLWLSSMTNTAMQRRSPPCARPRSCAARAGGAIALGGRLDRRHERDPRRDDPPARSFDGAVSLGRVQTPTLAIVARREEEIRAFVPEPYWLVDARSARTANARAMRAASTPRQRQGARPADRDRAAGRRDRRRVHVRPGTITSSRRESSARKRRCSTT